MVRSENSHRGWLGDVDEGLEWLPVVEIGERDWLGVRRSGEWVLDREGQLVSVESLSFVPALPLLQRERELFELEVQRRLGAVGIGDTSRYGFPVPRLLEQALLGGMEFWADLALKWLESADVDERLLKALVSLQDARWASQRTRQRARQVVKQCSGHV
ncbi:hypothetical protein [Corallococcus sp. CA047B]|uniref:hypothetical protein n=1 Tax=Corallococcus sp. CA047B TaxID=2316729 RepID=UPI0011C3D538|nr:hypothetical protein [Corallococcus sp. CA047B]